MSFATTRWSVVLSASSHDTLRARDALARLCQTYWYPLYSFVRQRGHSAEDAQDLTQEFLARLLEKDWISDADKSKGRFRTFILTAMKHFLADEWDKTRAQKRGGDILLEPLQFDNAETRYSKEPTESATPERTFEKDWAMALLDEVLNRLRVEYDKESKSDLFAALHPCLIGERTDQPYAELAKSLDSSESMVKSAVHRLRQRYRQLLRDEIANTVSSSEAVDDEMRYLFAILSR